MRLLIHNTDILAGQVAAPSSKSHSIRAILLGLLARGRSVLSNVLISEDTSSALQVCRALGVNIQELNSHTIITSEGLPLQTKALTLQTGNSGITTHFILPILGLRNNTNEAIVVDCDDQMRSRPISALVDALRRLGLHIDYLKREGQMPVSISGELTGGKSAVRGVTSQYLSALLLSLPCAKQDSELLVDDLQERPYVDMTIDYMKNQGIEVSHRQENNTDSYFIKGNQSYSSFEKVIPGDFSSASYLMAAGVLLNGNIELRGLDMQDSQGDKKLVNILQEMGADIKVEDNRLLVRGGRPLNGVIIDAVDIPDLLPTLAVIGCFAAGKTEIRHVRHARIKETDRIQSMMKGLVAMGARIEEHTDGLTVYESKLYGAEVDGFDDHRTVMALSLAGLLAKGITVINGSEAINKTFPSFVDCMRSLGAKMQVES